MKQTTHQCTTVKASLNQLWLCSSLLMLAITASPDAATYTWTGATNTAFATTSNWSPGGSPSGTDTIVFNASSINKCIISSNVTVNAMKLNAGFTDSVILIPSNMITTSNDLTIAAGVLHADSGMLDVNGSLNMSGGIFDRPGKGDVGSFYLAGSYLKTGGAVTWYPTGSINFDGTTGSYYINSGGTGAGNDLPKIVFAGATATWEFVTNNMTCDTLVLNNGTLNLGVGRTITTTGISINGGNLLFGSSKLQVVGDANFQNLPSLSPGTGWLEFTGSVNQNFTPKLPAIFPNIRKTGSGILSIISNPLKCDTLMIGSGATISFNNSFDTVAVIGGSGTLQMNSSTLAIIGGLADFSTMSNVSYVSGARILFTGFFPIRNFHPNPSIIFPRIEHYGVDTVIVLGGSLKTKWLTINGPGEWRWGSGLVHEVDTLLMNSGRMNFGSSTVKIMSGNADFTSSTKIIPASGMLNFCGTSANHLQWLYLPSTMDTFPALVHSGSDTLGLQNGLTQLVCHGFSQTNGSLYLGGKNIFCLGDFSITNGTKGSFARNDNSMHSLESRKIRADNTTITGQSGSRVNLHTWSMPCTLEVAGTVTLNYDSIVNCVLIGNQAVATNSYKGWGTKNLTFVRTWGSTSGTNWNDSLNWLEGQSPSDSSDSVVFNASGTANCILNVNDTIGSLNLTGTFTGSFNFNGYTLGVKGSMARLAPAGGVYGAAGSRLLFCSNANPYTFYPPSGFDMTNIGIYSDNCTVNVNGSLQTKFVNLTNTATWNWGNSGTHILQRLQGTGSGLMNFGSNTTVRVFDSLTCSFNTQYGTGSKIEFMHNSAPNDTLLVYAMDTLPDVRHSGTNGVIKLFSDLKCKSFVSSIGKIKNDYWNLLALDSCVIQNGTCSTFVRAGAGGFGIDNFTITTAKARFGGQPGNLLNLVSPPAGKCSLYVTGSVTADYANLRRCKAAGALGGGIAQAMATITCMGDTSDANWWFPLSAVPLPLDSMDKSSVAWGDYNGNGYLDLLLNGFRETYPVGPLTRLYPNTAGTAFTAVAKTDSASDGSVAWGDYDNDGDIDLLITGMRAIAPTATIYQNNSGALSNINAPLTPVYWSSAAWGDYNNDGRLDIAISGKTNATPASITKIYQNNGGGSFVDIGASLTAVERGALAFGDFDRDKDLDLLVTGWDGTQPISKLYRNDFGTFSDLGAGLPGVRFGAVAWGDYDADGYPDFVLCGLGTSVPISKIYHNNQNGTFSDINASITAVRNGSVSWGDYDSDGDLDLLLCGQTASVDTISALYRNDGSNTFVNVDAGMFHGIADGSTAWADFDNNGSLDLVMTGAGKNGLAQAQVFRNNYNQIGTVNTVPSTPTGLVSVTSKDTAILSWNKSTDTQTPQNGLSYNIDVSTSIGTGSHTMPSMSTSSGYRLIPSAGNTGNANSWKIQGLTPGKYYWKPQAIDNSFAGSAFGAVDSFTIDLTSPTVSNATLTSPNGNEKWIAGTQHLITWQTNAAYITDNSMLKNSPVRLEYSLDNGSTFLPTGLGDISNSGSVNWTLPTVTLSTLRMRIAITDSSGNTAYDTSNAVFALDGYAPNARTTSPVNRSLVSSIGTISGTATDSGSGVQSVQIIFYDTTAHSYYNGSSFADVAAVNWANATGTTSWTYNAASISLASGHTYIILAKATDTAGNTQTIFHRDTVAFDNLGPTVVVNKSTGQSDPTPTAPFSFDVTFSEPVTGFETNDVLTGGNAQPTGLAIAEKAPFNRTVYAVQITGTITNGAAMISIPSNVVTDATGNGNSASTAIDDTIIYNGNAPIIQFSINNRKQVFMENAGTFPLVYELSKAAGVGAVITVSYSGSATSTLDYTINTTGLTIPAGITGGSFNLQILEDNLDENPETVFVSLTSPVNVTSGAFSTDTIIIMDNDLHVVFQTYDTTVVPGGSFALRFTADGITPVLYRWKKNGVEIANANTGIFSKDSASRSDAGVYICEAFNDHDTVYSEPINLAVGFAPNIFLQPLDRTVLEGDSVILMCAATGANPLLLAWFKRGSTDTVAYGTQLWLNPVTAADTGSYFCVVSNADGFSTSRSGHVTLVPSSGAIVARFGASPLTAMDSALVTFVDSSSGSIVRWIWSFGDGTTDTIRDMPGRVFGHVYHSPGVYTVTLTVVNALQSNTCIKTNLITILNRTTPQLAINQVLSLAGDSAVQVRLTRVSNASAMINRTLCAISYGYRRTTFTASDSLPFCDTTFVVSGSYRTGWYYVALAVSDVSGNRSAIVLDSIMLPNSPPLLATRLPDFLLPEDTVWRITLTARDVNRDTLSWLVVRGPQGLTIGAYSGLIMWTPTSLQGGANTVEVLCKDNRFGVVSDTFVINVLQVNDPPITTLSRKIRAPGIGAAGYWFATADEESNFINQYRVSLSYSVSEALPHTILMDSLRVLRDSLLLFPLVDGHYQLRIVARDTLGAIDPRGIADTFTVNGATTHTLAGDTTAPWHCFSVPVSQYSATILKSYGEIVLWDESKPSRTIYSFYTPSSEIQTLTGGRSYWRKASRTTTISLSSNDLINTTVAIPIAKNSYGWNQVASPYPYPVKWSYNNNSLWEWNPATLSFDKADSVLMPWRGYWVQATGANDTVRLSALPALKASMLAKASSVAYTNKNEWIVRLSCASGVTVDADNRLGFSRGASNGYDDLDWPKPPMLAEGRSIYFPHPEWKQPSTQFASDVRRFVEPVNVFSFAVSPGTSPAVVTINAPAQLLSTQYLYIASRDSISAIQQGSSITIKPSDSIEYRALFVSDNPAFKYVTHLTLLAPYPNPFHPRVNIEYTVPYQWSSTGLRAGATPVSIIIYDVLGRVVRTLVDRPQNAGVYRTLWDGKSTNGRRTAMGTYVVKLSSGKFSDVRKIVMVQ